jgi:HK97 family phage major capsid protein
MNLQEVQGEIRNFANALEEFKDRHNARADEIERKINQIHSGVLAGKGDVQAERFSRYCPRRFDTGYEQSFRAYLQHPQHGLSTSIQDSLSVGSDRDGGYLCPPDLTGRIVGKLNEISPVRSVASVQVLDHGDALEGIVDNEECESGWIDETGTRSDTTTPELGKWRVNLHEQYAQPKTTQKLLDTSSIFDVESWIISKIARRFARIEGRAFVLGSGIGQPRGFLDYASTAVTTGDSTRNWGVVQYIPSGQSAGFPLVSGATVASNADALFDTIAALKTEYRSSAVWAFNRTTGALLRKMKDENGRFLWQDGLQAGQPDRLCGYPIVFMEDMPDPASQSFSMAFGSFQDAYQIIDLPGISLLRDPYTEKPFVKFYARRRTGGDLVNSESLKFIKFAAS